MPFVRDEDAQERGRVVAGDARLVGRVRCDGCGDGVDVDVLDAIVLLSRGGDGVWLVTAAHMKAVPGRRTDVRDAEWIAQLLEHGLLSSSFVPPLVAGLAKARAKAAEMPASFAAFGLLAAAGVDLRT